MLSVKNDRCEVLNHESKTVYLAKSGLDESLSVCKVTSVTANTAGTVMKADISEPKMMS